MIGAVIEVGPGRSERELVAVAVRSGGTGRASSIQAPRVKTRRVGAGGSGRVEGRVFIRPDHGVVLSDYNRDTQRIVAVERGAA